MAFLYLDMKEVIGKYINAKHCIERLAYEILKYTKSFSGLIPNDAAYTEFFIYDEAFIIRYSYSCKEGLYTSLNYRNLIIPMQYIYGNTWKKYIRELAEKTATQV